MTPLINMIIEDTLSFISDILKSAIGTVIVICALLSLVFLFKDVIRASWSWLQTRNTLREDAMRALHYKKIRLKIGRLIENSWRQRFRECIKFLSRHMGRIERQRKLREMREVASMLRGLSRAYLERESVKAGEMSEAAMNDYATALQDASNRAEGYTLTNVDYRLIIKLGECDTSLFGLRSTILLQIVKIFIKKYKEEIINSLEEDYPLTEDEEMSIKCLCASVPLLRNNKKKELLAMQSLLKEVRPFVSKNVAMTQITETVLYKLCQLKNGHNKINNKMKRLCHEYSSMENVSEKIRLCSSVLMCLTSKIYLLTYDNGHVYAYISGVIDDMEIQGREDHLGFSAAQLTEALIQDENVASDGKGTQMKYPLCARPT